MSANNPISKSETSCFFLRIDDCRYYPAPFSLFYHCIICMRYTFYHPCLFAFSLFFELTLTKIHAGMSSDLFFRWHIFFLAFKNNVSEQLLFL